MHTSAQFRRHATGPFRQAARHRHRQALVGCLTVVLWLLAGCSGNTPAKTTPAGKAAADDWFCEMAEDNEQWECVQDSEKARNAKPTRLPKPKPPLPQPPPADSAESLTPAADSAQPAGFSRGPFDPSDRETNPVASGEREPANNTLDASPESPQQSAAGVKVPAAADTVVSAPSELSETPASPETDAESVAVNVSPDTPLHVRLAYQPEQPTPLHALPEDFWAVQLLALSSKEALEYFAEQHQLNNMSAARIAVNDQLFFVLLLGIYETRERAELAISELPPPFHTYTPWLRRMSTLQDAMRKGDKIANAE